jgi:phosphohistidine phosphatase
MEKDDLFILAGIMQILIIRHAKAGQRGLLGFIGKKDAARPLTDVGRRDMRKAARGLQKLVPEVDVLATSPLARARETADIVSRRYDNIPVMELAALAPGGSKEDVLAWLRDQKATATVALVGHEPDLGMLSSWLLGGGAESFLSLKKGAACLIEMSETPTPGSGRLEWLLPPAALRKHG